MLLLMVDIEPVAGAVAGVVGMVDVEGAVSAAGGGAASIAGAGVSLVGAGVASGAGAGVSVDGAGVGDGAASTEGAALAGGVVEPYACAKTGTATAISAKTRISIITRISLPPCVHSEPAIGTDQKSRIGTYRRLTPGQG
jgi:hypothetical protein